MLYYYYLLNNDITQKAGVKYQFDHLFGFSVWSVIGSLLTYNITLRVFVVEG